METIEEYLARKRDELHLLNSCLTSPLDVANPMSVTEVIRYKFQITAALRAEHALHDWTTTETAWSENPQTVGPFEFEYDYQRADLKVGGPSFYGKVRKATYETVYTASGMAAIAALLLASAQVIKQAELLVLQGTYPETLELVERYAPHLRIVPLSPTLDEIDGRTHGSRIFLLDSCAPGDALRLLLRFSHPILDLLIFDTTCFSGGSGRIRRVLDWARKRGIPVVMIRSHTKLDSLGAEYGRLGSAAFVHCEGDDPWMRSKFRELPDQTRNAVRLLGGAALPAHFPPYIGTSSYSILTKKRMAVILRNYRRALEFFKSIPKGPTVEHFSHGLYIKLGSAQEFDEKTARHAARELSKDLNQRGLPIRHAGSFGFDFAAAEWCQSSVSQAYRVRLSVSDLPTSLWDDVLQAVAEWWWRAQQRTAQDQFHPEDVTAIL
jgi:hypothetical protein